MFWTSLTLETSKILHFRNCTSNCSNSLRVLEPSRTLSNLCSQKIELNDPGFYVNLKRVNARFEQRAATQTHRHTQTDQHLPAMQVGQCPVQDERAI